MQQGQGIPSTQKTNEATTQPYTQVKVLKVTTERLPPADVIQDDSSGSSVIGVEGKNLSLIPQIGTDSDQTPDNLSDNLFDDLDDFDTDSQSPVFTPTKSRRSLCKQVSESSQSTQEESDIIII